MRKIGIVCICIGLLTSFSQKKFTWVAIGDSITYLNDHLDETDHRVTKGYMTLIKEKHPELDISNQGHNGWTAGGIAAHFDSLNVVKADVYTIFLGTNDWWSGRPLGTMADYQNNTGNNTVYGSFRIIVNKIHALNAGARIIFITPMQRSDFVYLFDMKNNAYGSYKEKNGQLLEQFAQAVMNIANKEHAAVIDLFHKKELSIGNLVKYKRLRDGQTGQYKNFKYPEYIGVPFDPLKDEYPYPREAGDMTFDGLHPSDTGYAVIASMLEEKMF